MAKEVKAPKPEPLKRKMTAVTHETVGVPEYSRRFKINQRTLRDALEAGRIRGRRTTKGKLVRWEIRVPLVAAKADKPKKAKSKK